MLHTSTSTSTSTSIGKPPLRLPFSLFLLLLPLASSQSPDSTTSLTPTTLHFFPRTSCNRGTSLSYTTVADLYADNTCHTTPVGTEALYVDGIAGGCAVQAFSDSACSPSALLSQVPIGAGICQFYGEGNAIGAWMGVCGAGVGAGAGGDGNASTVGETSTTTALDGRTSTSSAGAFSTMSALGNSTGSGTGTGTGEWMSTGSVTATFRATQTQPATPGLQSSGTGGVVESGGVGLWEEGDWARGMMMKALLAMGSAEVVWGWGFV